MIIIGCTLSDGVFLLNIIKDLCNVSVYVNLYLANIAVLVLMQYSICDTFLILPRISLILLMGSIANGITDTFMSKIIDDSKIFLNYYYHDSLINFHF